MKIWAVLLAILATSLAGNMNDAMGAPMPPPWKFSVYQLIGDGKGVLYAATSAGLFRSAKGGTDWRLCVVGNADSIVLSPDGALFASLGNHVYISRDGKKWVRATRKDEPATWGGGELFVDAKGILFMVGGANGNLRRSTDGGMNWSEIASNFRVQRTGARWFAESHGTIYVASREDGGELILSEDRGVTWKADRYFYNNKLKIKSLMTDGDGMLYVATGNGRFMKKSTPAGNWTEILPAPEESTRRDLIAVDSRALYAKESSEERGHVLLKGTKSGQGWSSIMDGLPITRGMVFSSLITNAPDALYLNTTAGIYKSTNGGKNWIPASTGMPLKGSWGRPSPSNDGC